MWTDRSNGVNVEQGYDYRSKPVVFAAVVVLSIGVSEYLVMLLLERFKIIRYRDIIDAVTLSLIISPVLYYIIFNPMREKINRIKNLLEDKDRLNDSLSRQASIYNELQFEYRFLLDTLPDIVYKIDANGNFTFVNNAITRLGYTPEDIIGRHFSVLIDQDEVDLISSASVLSNYQNKATGDDAAPKLIDERRTGNRCTRGLEVHLVKRHATSKDELIVGEISSSGIYQLDADASKKAYTGSLGLIKTHKYAGTSGVIRDITKRYNEIDSMVNIKNMLEDITQGMSLGISLLTDDSVILWANKTAERHAGRTLQEMIGRYCNEILHQHDEPCDSQFHPCPLHEVKETGKPSLKLHTHFDNDGNKRYIEVTAYPITESDTGVVRYIHVTNDITDKHMLQEELKHKNAMLNEINTSLGKLVDDKVAEIRHKEQLLIQQSKMAAMGEMMQMIAHQWYQPLNAISLNVQDIKDAYEYGELDQKYMEEVVDITLTQVNFMAKTIDDFRNFYTLSKKKVRFDVKNNIEVLFSMFAQVFKKIDIDISIMASSDVLMFIDGYPNEFKHVILNMLNNSKDAITTQPHLQGRIEINIYNNEQRDKVLISIKDNGGGIPAHIIERIFDPYFTTKDMKGTGVGLYMSKTIIETHMGGTLTVTNVEGGTEFIITLDVAGTLD
ncbi:multi-sensor signal transduction histidine kinase [Candidatus Magnetominusculus xianensis]|uniref:histidine kinase n=1 Tax=Candidatus Magnetominusculus xianensis TaxID=1748249 RepID=A0ABR5SFG7_9BACT|nr:multi-sensor signal transduction histidine kinase [Candidatus Magnetominusculus xianensis]